MPVSAALSAGLVLLAGNAFACIAVEGDRILARDLAAADPWFAQVDPGGEVGMTPLAGFTRVIRRRELAELARSLKGPALPGGIPDICIERAATPLTQEQLQPVLNAASGAPPVTILEFSRYRIPRGAIEFRLADLAPNGLWKGRVFYGSNHSVPVWARIRLAPGGNGASRIDAREIERGTRIQVEVTSGAARLAFEAIAESAGRRGDSVLVRNPENGHLFQAKVLGNGKVAVYK